MTNVDIGKMFLNYPLVKKIWPYTRVIMSELVAKEKKQGGLCVSEQRNGTPMGFI